MDTAYKVLLTFHIVVGSLSLITFWIPVFVKKGGDIHVKVGKLYVILMWMVVISAIMLSVINLTNGRYIIAAFLGYLAVITAHPLWYGIVVLKHKQNLPDKVRVIKAIFNWLLLVGGCGLLLWSIILKVQGPAILLFIFGSIGVISSIPLLFSKKKEKANWLADHIEGMITTGIAAYTAFFAFGGGQFMGHIFSGSLIAIPWILPTVIGVFVIKRYKRKMNFA